MHQGVLLPDGPSDLPLSRLLERVCLDLGASVAIQPVDPRSLGDWGRSVEGRLRFLREADIKADLVFVHRDAERDHPDTRREEVLTSPESPPLGRTLVPVVPVRMTEAWLLLDETAIRVVAGRPNGRVPLDLPKPREVEAIADPKERLKRALEAASEAKGRRLDDLRRSFPRNRRLLLERLDSAGPVTELAAWKRLRADVESALEVVAER